MISCVFNLVVKHVSCNIAKKNALKGHDNVLVPAQVPDPFWVKGMILPCSYKLVGICLLHRSNEKALVVEGM